MSNSLYVDEEDSYDDFFNCGSSLLVILKFYHTLLSYWVWQTDPKHLGLDLDMPVGS